MGYTCRPLKLHVTRRRDATFNIAESFYRMFSSALNLPRVLAPTHHDYNLWLCVACTNHPPSSRPPSCLCLFVQHTSQSFALFTFPRTNIVCVCVCLCLCVLSADASTLVFGLWPYAHCTQHSLQY